MSKKRSDCPGCCRDEDLRTTGRTIVCDMLASCSVCSATIQSIDQVHTCSGGELCERCWKARGPVYVHVVMGTCGEYSDRMEWPVAAFFDESRAQELVIHATQWVHDHAAEARELERKSEYTDDVELPTSPYDPGLLDGLSELGAFEDVSYFVVAVPLARNEQLPTPTVEEGEDEHA